MSGPQRTWWLNITLGSVLLFLVRCLDAAAIDNDALNATSQSMNLKHNDNYEMIDVAQREGSNNLQVQTGQTTRILTSGEVDDNFWLKHLGEDFKYAIHLQVDDDPYNGIYNMTEDGSNYEKKHDYRIKDIPVDSNRGETPESRHDNHINSEIRNANAIYRRTNITAVKTNQEAKNYDGFYTYSDRGFPLLKQQSFLKKRNGNHEAQVTEYTKSKKVQNINIKFKHKQKQTQNHQEEGQQEDVEEEQEDISGTSNEENNGSIGETSPIVVTLPNNEKSIHHLADEDTPVVVKMPPVIYHQGPAYTEYTSDENTNQTTQLQHSEQMLSTHNQYTSHQNLQPTQYENTDFTQYNPIPSNPPGSLHLSHSPAASQYYNPTMVNEPPVYHSDAVYTSSPPSPANGPNSIPISSPKEQLQKPTDSIRFILRKPSTPYNGQASHNQVPLENAF